MMGWVTTSAAPTGAHAKGARQAAGVGAHSHECRRLKVLW
jgi:hypothetical protein